MGGDMKSIYSGGLKQHWTRKGNVMKPKMAFDTPADAKRYRDENGISFKYKPYLCDVCNKYHLGHHK